MFRKYGLWLHRLNRISGVFDCSSERNCTVLGCRPQVMLRYQPFRLLDRFAGTLSRAIESSRCIILRALLPLVLSSHALCLAGHAALGCFAEGLVLTAVQQIRVVLGDRGWIIGHLIADLG